MTTSIHTNNEYGRLYSKGMNFADFSHDEYDQEIAYCVEWGAKDCAHESRIFLNLEDAKAFYEAVFCTMYDKHEKELYSFETATGTCLDQYGYEESF